CTKIVAQAALARAAANDKPVMVLLDHDGPGRDALKLLTSERFRFQKGKEVLSYAEVFPKAHQDFPYEAEDLFPTELLDEFVSEHGKSVVDGMLKRPDGEFHYDLNSASKELLFAHLQAAVTP